jgi:hypothetical protein
MKDPYQLIPIDTETKESFDTFGRKPLDFRTEEERAQIAATIEQRRVAEIEQRKEASRQVLVDKEAARHALIKRQEKWLAAWHIGLFIGVVFALVKIVDTMMN